MSDAPPRAPDVGALSAIVLGALAWASLLAALLTESAVVFLGVGLILGAVALVLGLRARRDAALVAGVAGAAGLTAVYGAAVAAMLVAAVYATGLLVLLVFAFLIALLASGAAYQGSSAQGGGSCCGDCRGCTNCDPGSCCDACCSGCCTGCDCGCGGCGCGGCGGCGCAGLGLVGVGRVAPPQAPLGWRDRFAHHPDAPEYQADVLRVAGARLCIGCFVTYPGFLVATLALTLAPPPLTWSVALLAGVALSAAQLVSTVGLARWRWAKLLVKSSLAIGLALYAWGVLAAPWVPLVKVAALAFALGLALASAIPRARRMRRARAAACACQAATRAEA